MPADANRRLPTRSLLADGARELDIDGKKVPYFNQPAWAGMATSNGLPATTMSIGHDDGGLPIGVQIISGYLDDNTTIAFSGPRRARVRRLHPASESLSNAIRYGDG